MTEETGKTEFDQIPGFDLNFSVKTAGRNQHIDFSGFLSNCEMNYLKLLKVFPSIHEVELRQIEMYFLNGRQARLHLQIVERTNHTSRLSLCLYDQNAYLKQAEMEIRVYHDMKVVEVLNVQSIDVRKSTIRRSTSGHLQTSERLQVSKLLSEWLGHCLEFGVVPVEIKMQK